MHRFWLNCVRRGTAVLAGSAMMLPAACGEASSPVEALTRWQGDPFVQGYIAEMPVGIGVHDMRYLVLAQTAPGEDPVGAYFNVRPGTRLVWEDGQPAPENALQIGRRVSVWIVPGSAVLYSLPPQIVVSAVVLHDRAQR